MCSVSYMKVEQVFTFIWSCTCMMVIFKILHEVKKSYLFSDVTLPLRELKYFFPLSYTVCEQWLSKLICYGIAQSYNSLTNYVCSLFNIICSFFIHYLIKKTQFKLVPSSLLCFGHFNTLQSEQRLFPSLPSVTILADFGWHFPSSIFFSEQLPQKMQMHSTFALKIRWYTVFKL